MTKPSKDVVCQIREDVMTDLRAVRERLQPMMSRDPKLERAFAGVETFINISLRVMAQTNVSKIRRESVAVEIAARIAGHQVFSE